MLGSHQGQAPDVLAHDAASPEGIALTWSDELRTGLEVIDEQHKTLVGIFNALAAAQARGTETQAMAALFEELVRYTREHFRTEAELMQDWPLTAAHRAMHLRAHQSFINFLRRAQALSQSSPADVAVDLLAFLAQWLLHHIMGVDARMARQIHALQGAPDAAALAQREQPMAEDVLVDSVSRLNDALGHRTFALLELNGRLQAEIEQRNSMEHRLTRLKDFNTLLAQVNQAITVHDDEDALLSAICDLAVLYGGLKLAWIARPDAHGRFQKVAASGETSYLKSVHISADADVPQGQGSMGRAWRDGVASFNQSFGSTVALKPWQALACSLGLRANASLPLYRDARIWAVLTVYHEQEHVFDAELKAVLEALALDVSRGLDRLDLIARERQSSLVRESLLSNALAGIVMTQGARIVDANAHFARMLGYAHQRDLVGQSTRSLYPDEGAFARVRSLGAALGPLGSAQLASVRLQRRDGGVITCDLSGTVAGTTGQGLVVWTAIDVTERDGLQQKIRFEALHDTLTGLPNRRALDHDLPKALARARRSGTVVAVGMIDLDDFKPVNDVFGHASGDHLLQELGQRLQVRLRASDILARIGGDEFVVVIEDLDFEHAAAQLGHVLNRLHEAVESPFAVGHGAQAVVGMSMGVALFPVDAQDADALVRHADGAMYQVKLRKHDRAQWWGLDATRAPHAETEFDADAFGPAAVALLGKVQGHFQDVAAEFVERFYGELSLNGVPRAILGTLNAEELSVLKVRQAEHLGFLLHPNTTREAIVVRARHLGQVHALVGVSGAWLSKSQSLYRQLLGEHLNHALLHARERYRILRAAENRIQEDVQAELEMEAQTTAAYLNVLASALPPQGSRWVDASSTGVEGLGALPGVQAVLLMRLKPDGAFAVEASAGRHAHAVALALQTPGTEAVLDPASARGQGMTAQAWRSLQIMSSPAYGQDPRYAPWSALAKDLGIRSTLSIPVLNSAAQVVVVISFFGAYPHQFESPVMQQFARGLQHRWEQIWALSMVPAPVVEQDQAQLYRQTILTDGLRMFMQPVVDLRSGAVTYVEALARLVMPDGDIIAPSVFLPLLGAAELDRLFRLGLDRTLAHVAEWDAQGLSIGVSVNLPPSTLLDPECPRWVEETLHQYGLAPSRLTLELLESQTVDTAAQDGAIGRLRALGVKLAMDDLGSGYSSLLRLSTLPFDTIKIDQGLLLHVRDNPVRTLSLVSNILQMGRDFGREVVVEGLEDDALMEAVSILGASFGQGYGIARPMPASDLLAWHQARPRAANRAAIEHELGALAYHWQRMHAGDKAHDCAVDDCPVTPFLKGRAAPSGEEATAWHAQVHEGTAAAAAAASDKLTRWLVARVQGGVAC